MPVKKIISIGIKYDWILIFINIKIDLATRNQKRYVTVNSTPTFLNTGLEKILSRKLIQNLELKLSFLRFHIF